MRRIPRFALLLLLITFPVFRLTAATPDAPDSSAPAKQAAEGRIPIGVGVKVSTLGIGGEVAIAVSHRSNVRFGFNAFSYGDTFVKDGVTYKGNLDLRSPQATYAIFLLKDFPVTPAVLFYNGTQVTAHPSPPGGNSF